MRPMFPPSSTSAAPAGETGAANSLGDKLPWKEDGEKNPGEGGSTPAAADEDATANSWN